MDKLLWSPIHGRSGRDESASSDLKDYHQGIRTWSASHRFIRGLIDTIA
ncbi:hypothetical protein RIB2604_01704670 [Aspergillus luchuensis]|uniref:Uncharacterized protein n=1 Tax=Aspergillus kawachii TaxID=1069201 RepID=A0A146FCF9_ASPKA|nr:hypothetical protein RIB2604_01704670 [Aspergillus luchuensis]